MTELTIKSTDAELAAALKQKPDLAATLHAEANVLRMGMMQNHRTPPQIVAGFFSRFMREARQASDAIAGLRVAIQHKAVMQEFASMSREHQAALWRHDATATRPDGMPAEAERQDALRAYPALAMLLDRHLAEFAEGQRRTAEAAERAAQAKLAARPAELISEAEAAGATLSLDPAGEAIAIERVDLLPGSLIDELRSFKPGVIKELATREACRRATV